MINKKIIRQVGIGLVLFLALSICSMAQEDSLEKRRLIATPKQPEEAKPVICITIHCIEIKGDLTKAQKALLEPGEMLKNIVETSEQVFYKTIIREDDLKEFFLDIRAKKINSPRLTTFDGQKGSLSIVKQIPYACLVRDPDGTLTFQEADDSPIPVGINLEITSYLKSPNTIELKGEFSISERIGWETSEVFIKKPKINKDVLYFKNAILKETQILIMALSKEKREDTIEKSTLIVAIQATKFSFGTACVEESNVITGTLTLDSQYRALLPEMVGRILAVSDKYQLVVIDGGEKEGIKVGDKFRVYREPNANPEDFVGEVLVEKVDQDWSSGMFTSKDSKKPQVGDTVRRLKEKE